MWSLFISASSSAIDSLSSELWELGTAGLIEKPTGLLAFFEDTVEREPVCARFGVTRALTRDEIPFDSPQALPIECDPVLIGQRFYVAPSWVAAPSPEGRIRVTIDTTSAFGSGRHESTQLCMEILEKHLRPGSSIVDIGCGSGILSAAAVALGARTVISCNIHEGSVNVARALVQTPIFIGSADGMRDQIADMVLANLSLKVLDVVACDLQRIAKRGGLIIVGGFLHESPPKKFKPREMWRKDDWECWVCRPEDIDGAKDPGEPEAHSQQWWL